MKKVVIIYSEYTPTIDAIIAHLKDFEVKAVNSVEEIGACDLLVNTNYEKEIPQNHINVHYSLLPAFSDNEPVKEAFLAGVKVTGISFYYTNPERIIAQYPIFISNFSHYDDIERELEYLEQTIYPLILEKILRNEPFEIRKLLTKGCSGNCGGCDSCKH